MLEKAEAEADDVEKARIVARNERVMENQGLIYKVARGFRSRGVELDDLVQFGNIGLIRAAEKFEPGRGFRFSTYAVHWIRQAIYKGIADTSRPIRVPQHAQKEAAAVHRCVKAMEVGTGTKPWLSEALDAMVVDGTVKPAKRERILRAAEAEGARFDVMMLEQVCPAADGPTPESVAIDAEHRERLGVATGRLSEEHLPVLTRRYGLDGSPPLKIRARAALLGLSRRDTGKIERAALAEVERLLGGE